MVDQELGAGLRSGAALVRDRTGRVTAAVNVWTVASRVDLETVHRRLVPVVRAAAARIEADARALA